MNIIGLGLLSFYLIKNIRFFKKLFTNYVNDVNIIKINSKKLKINIT